MSKADKKDLIARTALTAIREEGVFRFSLGGVAQRAGVSVGTIYNNFGSKEELLAYLHNQAINSVFELVLKLEHEPLNLREVIICTTCFQFYIRSLHKDNSGIDLVSTNRQLFGAPDSESAQAMKASMTRIIGYRREQFLQGIAAGKILSSQEHALSVFRKMTVISRGTMIFSNHVFVPWGALPLTEAFELCDLVLSTLEWNADCQQADHTKMKIALRSIIDTGASFPY
ncbi:TetR/AcrR family transcriptional regulator [Ferrimonas sp. SCSIO 43195]|uniref:TetR/AcrR family transcriptional regulator n=1 Tax=Ferrimonas sp. SCSIO 43195 TaxID=2822844 RepID=UPI002075E040|nr:TetR/AcrR family transcriptional regulator [Ferrimonas sp. SCSIO 43195]USD36604.1 TetR/AcrR family transcriptional regulator [Ferrimonas sp. SCSIO 43195]